MLYKRSTRIGISVRRQRGVLPKARTGRCVRPGAFCAHIDFVLRPIFFRRRDNITTKMTSKARGPKAKQAIGVTHKTRSCRAGSASACCSSFS